MEKENGKFRCPICWTVLEADFVYCPICGEETGRGDIQTRDGALIREAEEYIRLGQYAAAKKLLQSLLETSPTNARYLTDLVCAVSKNYTDLEANGIAELIERVDRCIDTENKQNLSAEYLAFESKFRPYLEEQTRKAAAEEKRKAEEKERIAKEKAEQAGFEIDDNGTLTNYTGEDTVVVIPSFVKRIGEKAFYKCETIIEVHIPNSVTHISENAFSNCEAIIEVHIPDSVTYIGRHAFWRCSSITKINIPDSVTDMGTGVFSCCSRLTSINVGEKNARYRSIDGNLYTKDGKTLVMYATGKPDSAFAIPEGTTYILGSAFYGCRNLTDVTVPMSMKSIGEFAFCCCFKLTKINIPASITNIYTYTFNCTSLAEIHVPDSVTNIDKHAFMGTDLKSVSVPAGCKIGEGAFPEGCKVERR